MLILVDSQLLSWGLRHSCTQGQEQMLIFTADFFDWIADEGHNVVVSAVTVEEYLVNCPEDTWDAEMASLSRDFRIVPYDIRAAQCSARLRRDKSFTLALRQTENTTLSTLKKDMLIAGTAAAINVDVVYSHDKALRRYCELLGVKAEDVANFKRKSQAQIVPPASTVVSDSDGQMQLFQEGEALPVFGPHIQFSQLASMRVPRDSDNPPASE